MSCQMRDMLLLFWLNCSCLVASVANSDFFYGYCMGMTHFIIGRSIIQLDRIWCCNENSVKSQKIYSILP